MKLRFFHAMSGYILVGIASGLFVYCGLSADCYNTLVQGIAPFLRLSIGTSSYLIQMALLAAVLLLGGRRHAGIGTIAGSMIVSVLVNFFGAALSPMLLAAPLPLRMLLILLGTALAGLGLAMVQVSGFGSTANDILPILLSERLPRLQFRTVRIAFDCTEVLIGVLLGSSFGFGTLCTAFLIGPWLQLSLRLLSRPRPVHA